MKTNTSIFLDIRGLRYQCRVWGEAGRPKLFMLHGWMDVSASFQFLADAMQAEWQVIAPDWRLRPVRVDRRIPTGSPITWAIWTGCWRISSRIGRPR
jgi:pimeloyl-ACP methyl ester carboxylesterase